MYIENIPVKWKDQIVGYTTSDNIKVINETLWSKLSNKDISIVPKYADSSLRTGIPAEYIITENKDNSNKNLLLG